jgi:hypothetical protein
MAPDSNRRRSPLNHERKGFRARMGDGRRRFHAGDFVSLRIDMSGHAKVAELVDALALGASGATRESSSLSFRTNSQCNI